MEHPSVAQPPAAQAAKEPVVAGLLLAAGGGRRLGGRPKALLRHRGRPLVEHAVRVLREGGCGPVHVVLGASSDRVREEADLSGCVLVDNPGWEEGMGSSLRAGLDSLTAAAAVDAALVCLVDQPGIGAEAVARVRVGVPLPGCAPGSVVRGCARAPGALRRGSLDGDHGERAG